jgi:amino acid synthesis protein
MELRKTVTLLEEINSEYGARANPPLRRVAIAAVFKNPLAGKAPGADLAPLIEASLELGVSLTKAALEALRAKPADLRAYTKAALVGTDGDLEHGAAMIHPRLGMAMRRTIRGTPKWARPARVSICCLARLMRAGTSMPSILRRC